MAAVVDFAVVGGDFAVEAAFTGAGFAEDLVAADFAAGFFADNLGFSTFFALAGFETARLVGIVCRSRPESKRGPVCRTRDYTGEFSRVQ